MCRGSASCPGSAFWSYVIQDDCAKEGHVRSVRSVSVKFRLHGTKELVFSEVYLTKTLRAQQHLSNQEIAKVLEKYRSKSLDNKGCAAKSSTTLDLLSWFYDRRNRCLYFRVQLRRYELLRGDDVS
jgi:hypothetical protein